MTSHEPSDRRSSDLLSRPRSAVFWWGLPLVAGWSANFAPIPPLAATLVWAAALAWMGVGCTLNARRCHRLHCYIAAPVLFLGAAAAALVGLGWTPWGAPAASYVINGALALALLTFLAEPIWGKYRTR
jgi:hypothetical protein